MRNAIVHHNWWVWSLGSGTRVNGGQYVTVSIQHKSVEPSLWRNSAQAADIFQSVCLTTVQFQSIGTAYPNFNIVAVFYDNLFTDGWSPNIMMPSYATYY